MSIEIRSNSNNGGLMPIPLSNRAVMGHVDEVNGKGAEEIASFNPTRHELKVLVKYWMKQILNIDFFWLIYAQTGSTEIRLGPFADRRIERIREVLGSEEVDKAVEEARDQFKQDHQIDEEVWRIFTTGSPDEIRAFQDKCEQEEIEYCERQARNESNGSGQPLAVPLSVSTLEKSK